MKRINVRIAEKLLPIFTKKKRIKIAVGGRGGSKSIAFADAFTKFCADGEKLLCAREYQNSIDDSVHSLIQARINELGADMVHARAKDVVSRNKGEIIYKGLAKNPDAIKSLYGVSRCWVEEAATLSQDTIDTLLPTIRETDSELWFSLNRGSSTDAFSKTFLKPYEKYIERDGYYEDENMLIVEINYYDNPWFPEVLEKQRLSDKERLPVARYEHIWLGKYSDTVDNAIIVPEWFDACIDAHTKLGFRPTGIDVVTHDPGDSGDFRALCHRKGSVFLQFKETGDLDINDACDWSTDYADDVNADVFNWDGVGVGLGLKRQITNAFEGKHTQIQMFMGSYAPYWPDTLYEPIDGEISQGRKPIKNKDLFANARAQSYWLLRDRMYKTYLAVEKGEYHDPDELISFSSDIEDMDTLRSQICRIPRKPNSEKIRLYSKEEMKRLFDIDSPNMADCGAMSMCIDVVHTKKQKRQLTAADYAVPKRVSPFAQ